MPPPASPSLSPHVPVTATLKLLFIGNSAVGKSSLLLRFTDDTFHPADQTTATIGLDFKVKLIDAYDGKRYKLSIWDTAGQERFRTLTSSYYRGAQGVVLVYDVTNRETFNNLVGWFRELDTYTGKQGVVKLLIGNKVDREGERQVRREEGERLAKERGCIFYECSAKARVGVQEAMEELVQKIVDTPSLWVKKQGGSTGSTRLNQNAGGWAPSCAC